MTGTPNESDIFLTGNMDNVCVCIFIFAVHICNGLPYVQSSPSPKVLLMPGFPYFAAIDSHVKFVSGGEERVNQTSHTKYQQLASVELNALLREGNDAPINEEFSMEWFRFTVRTHKLSVTFFFFLGGGGWGTCTNLLCPQTGGNYFDVSFVGRSVACSAVGRNSVVALDPDCS